MVIRHHKSHKSASHREQRVTYLGAPNGFSGPKGLSLLVDLKGLVPGAAAGGGAAEAGCVKGEVCVSE